MPRPMLALLLFLLPLAAALGQVANEGERLLSQGSTAYQQGDYTRAYDSLSRAVRFYQAAGDRENLMAARLWAGAAAAGLGRAVEAEGLYRGAFELADELADPTWGGNIATAIGNLKTSLGAYVEASEWFLRAAGYFRGLGDAASERASTEYAGYMLALAGHYEDAFAIFDAALQGATGRTAAELAWLRGMRGLAGYSLDRFGDALSDYREAARLLLPGGDSLELARAYGWMGKILSDTGGGDDALEHLNLSLEMARRLRSPEDEARAAAYIGFHHGRDGDYGRGARHYEDSLRIARSMGDASFIVAACDSLSWLYEQAGEKEKAAEAKRQQIEAAGDNGDEGARAVALNDYGLLLYYAGHHPQAAAAYTEALALHRALGNRRDESVILLNLGVALEESGDSQAATRAIEESIAISLALGQSEDVEEASGFLAELYGESYEHDKLISLLTRIVPIFQGQGQGQGRRRELMYVLNEIGIHQYAVGKYEDAITSYGAARTIARELGAMRDEAAHMHNMGQAQASLSRFDLALQSYTTALALAQVAGAADAEANVQNSIGELYRAWGWYERSLTHYRQAEQPFTKAEDPSGLASVHNNMGQAIRQGGDPEGSMDLYRRALALNTELGDEEARAINLSNLGEAHRESGDLETARVLYGEALAIDSRIKNLRGMTVRKNDIALILLLQGKAQESIPYFEEGLAYWKSVGSPSEEATALQNLGDATFELDRYTESAGYLEQAVAILERLRLTASGAVRREYLQSQIHAYRGLARSYLHAGEVWKSLYALEQSRAKYLLEQMGAGLESTSFDYSAFVKFQERLGRGEALLSVARLDTVSYQLVLLDNRQVAGRAVYLDFGRIDALYESYSRQIVRQTQDPDGDRLDGLLTYYRYLLSRPLPSSTDRQAMDDIGAFLYTMAFGPMEEQLGGITSLIVVPDGLLALVPFECLRDGQGRYLIQRFGITYAQSLVVALETMERSHPAERKPLLAFGGASYELTESAQPGDPGDLGGLRLEAQQMAAANASTRSVYGRLGVQSWRNLPGSLEEVTLLGQMVEGSVVHTGRVVTESLVKELSLRGELADYRVIHFATHGIVLPQMPDLSAVVLSQLTDEGNNDGYLTAAEIARLDLDADFVALSACETGLGKVYQGEGVVGLTQAFLVAGADALVVSLWQVADESTRLFMTGLYTLVNTGMSFAQATTEMKRVFLKEGRYSSPFFWAPFVYYGNPEAGR